MKDKRTGLPLCVSIDRRAGPYLTVPFDQMASVRKVLDQAGIPYWVDETAISVSGGPMISVINFSRSLNPDVVQDALDRAPGV